MKAIPDYRAMFVDGYDQHNVDRTLAGRLLQKSHRILEATLPSDVVVRDVVEVGAGSGHHFSYVQNKERIRYVMSDANEGMLKLASARYHDQVAAGELVIEQQDASRLTYHDQAFDRLIATHVLEHMPNPVAVLQEWNRVVRPSGLISLVLPCDPGLAWRVGRSFGPRRNWTRMGADYDYIMAAEHINPIFNLVVFIRHHFENIAECWYPLKVPFADVNLFYVCHIRT